MDGLIFGLIDNGVLILGAFTGLEIERALPARFQTGLGAVIGAAIGNTVSDLLGAIADPALQPMALGITAGCMIAALSIPVIAKFTTLKG